MTPWWYQNVIARFSQIMTPVGSFAERSMSSYPQSLGTVTIWIHINFSLQLPLSLAHLCNPPGDFSLSPSSVWSLPSQPHILCLLNFYMHPPPPVDNWSLKYHNNTIKRRRRKMRTKKLYQSSPEALIWSFVLRSDEWRSFFQNTISLWKIENIEKQ